MDDDQFGSGVASKNTLNGRARRLKEGSVKKDSSRITSIKIAESEEEIGRCFPVMKQLREKLTAEEFVNRVEEQEREGYKLAFLEREGQVVGVAGFRIYHMLATGKTMYVDDLVTDGNSRSQGIGEALLKWLSELSRKEKCETLSLDSGTHRGRAHRFYFAQGMHIANYHFELALNS
jgi:GNAT superfamily N-acetyltransferase